MITRADRAALLNAVVAGLEETLPPSIAARGSGLRQPADVLVDSLEEAEVANALAEIRAGAGGELTVTKNGNMSFCSAESSALMVVNFLAPFALRSAPLLGLAAGGNLAFERGLRVGGVRAPVPPTLDAVYEVGGNAVFVEAKTAEPWRAEPKVDIATQYDAPAAAVSAGMVVVIESLRSGELRYAALDAAQLVKHLLGIHSALESRVVTGTAKLVLLTWRPTGDGRFADLFNELQTEVADFAGRVSDQQVRVEAITTRGLLQEWSASEHEWLRVHADALSARYEPVLV